jgi:hypothetical protein
MSGDSLAYAALRVAAEQGVRALCLDRTLRALLPPAPPMARTLSAALSSEAAFQVAREIGGLGALQDMPFHTERSQGMRLLADYKKIVQALTGRQRYLGYSGELSVEAPSLDHLVQLMKYETEVYTSDYETDEEMETDEDGYKRKPCRTWIRGRRLYSRYSAAQLSFECGFGYGNVDYGMSRDSTYIGPGSGGFRVTYSKFLHGNCRVRFTLSLSARDMALCLLFPRYDVFKTDLSHCIASSTLASPEGGVACSDEFQGLGWMYGVHKALSLMRAEILARAR